MNGYFEDITRIRDAYSVSFMQNNTDSPKEMVGLHWHHAYEILYIRRGSGKQRLNINAFPLHSGDIVFIQPGDLHATAATAYDGMDVDVIQFYDTVLLDKNYVSSHISSGIIRTREPHFIKIFDSMRDCRSLTPTDPELILSALAQLLVGYLIRASEWDRRSPSQIIEAICTFLEKSDDLHLNYVAHTFGYTPEHLSRKFHKETGVSYRNWCQRIRMQKAITLLSEGTHTISDIAEELGFSNESSFIRAFKHTYGTSPIAWRNYRFSATENESSQNFH